MRFQMGLYNLWADLPDPQIALMLLRSCLGTCRVNHWLRSLPPTFTNRSAVEVSRGLQDSVERIIGAPLAPHQWRQCSLPIKLGGIGICDPVQTVPFAYIAAVFGVVLSGLCPQLQRGEDAVGVHQAVEDALVLLPDPMIGTYTNPLHIWRESKRISYGVNLGKDASHQHWWSEAAARSLQNRLLGDNDVRDSFRLQCLSNPLSGAWLNILPGQHIGPAVDPTSYQHLVKFRLGVPLLPFSAIGSECAVCEEEPLDALGDHLLCCRKSNP